MVVNAVCQWATRQVMATDESKRLPNRCGSVAGALAANHALVKWHAHELNMAIVAKLVKESTHRGAYGGCSIQRLVHTLQQATVCIEGELQTRDIVIDQGRIVAMDDVQGEVIPAAGQLVTPGYVDPHTHLVYMGDRAFELGLKLQGLSYMEILQQGGGIQHTVGLTQSAGVDALVASASPRLQRMMSAGTVALDAKTGYALTTPGELRMLEASQQLAANSGITMRHTFLGAHAIPTGHTPQSYVDHILDEMLPAVVEQGIATCLDVFVEENVFTAEQGMMLLEAGAAAGLDTVLHADEIVNTEGAELAARAGCISADHLLRVSEEGIAAMAEAGTIANLMPTVPITLMRPEWTPARALLDAGVPVALATDHNPNNPVTNQQFVAQLASYCMRMTPTEALQGVTSVAAAAMGRSDYGSIAVGHRAGLLRHDVAGPDEWVYELGRTTIASQHA